MIELVAKRQQNSKAFKLNDTQEQIAVSIGAIHYRDASNQWQNIDANFYEADSGAYTARFTKLPYIIRMGDDGTRRIYPDRNDQSYWIDFGKPFANMGQPVKQGGYWIWDYPNAILGIKVNNGAVKLGFRLKNSNAPTSISFPFSVEGITRIGRFLYHNGKVVSELRKPFAIDAKGTERDVNVSFASGEITLSLNTTGLIFPIDIDPTWQVGASSDDARRRIGVAPEFNLLFSLYIGTWVGNNKHGSGMRFTGVTIPKLAIIETAKLTLQAMSSQAGTFARAKISAEDVDNAPTFADDADAFDTRFGNHTTARVEWNDTVPGSWEQVAPQFGAEGNPRAAAVHNGKIYAGMISGKLLEWNGVNAWAEKAPALGGEKIYCLASYDGDLYGGTQPSGKLYRWNGTNAWEEVAGSVTTDAHVYCLFVFDGSLYGGTAINTGGSDGGKLLCWNDLDAWVEVADEINGQDSILSLEEYGGDLYGGTYDNAGVTGGRLLKWNGVNAWTQVATTLNSQNAIYSLEVHNNRLFGGTGYNGKLFRWNDVDAWEEVADQLGAEDAIRTLYSLDGVLYGGTEDLGKLYYWDEVDAWEIAAEQLNGQIATIQLVELSGALYSPMYSGGRLFRFSQGGIQPWTINTNYDSPDIKVVIQEIVDRGGWVSGNAIVIFWEDYDDGSTWDGGSGFRDCESYDTDEPNAPKLVVTWRRISSPETTNMGAKMIAARAI